MKLQFPPFEAWYFAIILTLVFLFFGCATEHKAVDVGGKGVYVDYKSGKMAIGGLSVSTIPADAESVVFKVDEDTAWLSDHFLRDMDLRLTGTNSVSHASVIINAICGTFTPTNTLDRTEIERE